MDDSILNEFSASDGSDVNNVIETSPEVDTEWASSSAVKDRIIEGVTKRFPMHTAVASALWLCCPAV